MLGSLSLVDLLFLVTIVLLVFNGLRNGLVFSLLSLLSLPIAFVVAWLFGPKLTNLLDALDLVCGLVFWDRVDRSYSGYGPARNGKAHSPDRPCQHAAGGSGWLYRGMAALGDSSAGA